MRKRCVCVEEQDVFSCFAVTFSFSFLFFFSPLSVALSFSLSFFFSEIRLLVFQYPLRVGEGKKSRNTAELFQHHKLHK